MEGNNITRQELYELVWKESLTALSRRLNIPYSHLKKVCTEMNVPVPPNGHWSKLQFGKAVVVFELPENYQGTNEVLLEPVVNLKGNSTVELGVSLSIVDEINRDKSLPLKVAKRLTDPDKLIISAQKSLTEHPHAWRHNRGMVRTAWGELDVRVSPASLTRALCFLDALLKLLQARGHNVIPEQKFAMAVVKGEKFDFNLREKNQQVSFRSWNKSEFKPTGILTFMIGRYSGKTWSDTKAPIEKKLSEIVAKLETDAQKIKAERLIHQEEQRKREEREQIIRQQREEQNRIIREQRERIEKEKKASKNLLRQAIRLQRATFLRQYLDVVEERARTEGTVDDKFVEWVEWARRKADWYDPLLKTKDPILGFYDL